MACASGVRYEVKAQNPVLVQPSSKTESQYKAAPYFLTIMDQALANPAVALKPILVFHAKNAPATQPCPADGGSTLPGHPAKLLKEALAKVLVHFYPLAGRLRVSPDDSAKLFIECNDQGVLFVEAEANVSIAELGDLLLPDAATLSPLVSPLPVAMDDPPLLSFQLTRFKCGGFVLGMVSEHCLFDGVGGSEFLSAWGEIARGVAPPLSTPPTLDRTLLQSRSPLQISFPHVEYLNIEDAITAAMVGGPSTTPVDAVNQSFCFTSASLEILKKKVVKEGLISKCTVFEALTALIWRSRTIALWSQYPEQKVKLLIGVNARPHLRPALPKGYVGNGLVVAAALASAKELQDCPLSHAVECVQNAIKSASTDEFIRSQVDYMEHHKLGFPSLEAGLLVTSWSKLPFYGIDFGWGQPKHVLPSSMRVFAKEIAIYLTYGDDAKGINVLLTLPPKAMHTFEEILHPHLP